MKTILVLTLVVNIDQKSEYPITRFLTYDVKCSLLDDDA